MPFIFVFIVYLSLILKACKRCYSNQNREISGIGQTEEGEGEEKRGGELVILGYTNMQKTYLTIQTGNFISTVETQHSWSVQ